MKKSILTSISLLTTLGIVLFIYSCKKQTSQNDIENPFNVKTTAVSFPTFPNLERINDHLRHLAFGTASLFDTIYLNSLNSNNYISALETLVDNKSEEIEFEYINNNINSNLFKKFTSGFSPLNYDISINDAIQWSNTNYNIYNIRTNLWSPYDNSALAGFMYNNKEYNTTFGIPDYQTIKNDQSRLSKKIVVVPNELDGSDEMILPIIGFYYDDVNDVVDTILWQDEDDFEDDDRFYIWVIDYKQKINYNSGAPYNDCTGEFAPVTGDDYCDELCGENATNNPADCGNKKKVWIEEFEFIEDYKQRSSCGDKYHWLESKLGAKYEIGYGGMVVHGNGWAKLRGGVFENRIKQTDIVRSRKRGSCTYKNKGSNAKLTNIKNWMWWDDDISFPWVQNVTYNQPKAYISENYKPWRDTIYFILYEYDLYRDNRVDEVKIYYRNNRSASIQYCTRKNQGPIGDKNHQKLIYGFNSITPITASNNYINAFNTSHVIMITPNSWPNGGFPAINSDEIEIIGSDVLTGSKPNAMSIKVKLKYGPN